MKKYLAITAALALPLTLTACGQAAAVDVDGAKRITASKSAENRLASVPAGRIKGAAAA